MFAKTLLRNGVLLGSLLLAVSGCGSSGDGGGTAVRPTIVGGVPAIPHAWPSQVALLDSSKNVNYEAQFCGGTVISPDWVITAAHCVDGLLPGELDLAVGVSELSLAPDVSNRIPAAEIHVHPFYDPTHQWKHDVALVKLMSPTTAPALPYAGKGSQELYWDGSLAKAVGWGLMISDEGEVVKPAKLYEVDLPVLNDAVCLKGYGSSFFPSTMVCAGEYRTGGESVCSGDSGGPLMAATEAGWVLIGITSWTRLPCASPYYPPIFAEVASYSDFIESVTGVAPYRN